MCGDVRFSGTPVGPVVFLRAANVIAHTDNTDHNPVPTTKHDTDTRGHGYNEYVKQNV